MTALCIPLAVLLIVLAAWVDYRSKRDRKPMSTTEWRKGMAALEPGKPPVRTMEGDPDWRDPRKRRRKVKAVEVSAKVEAFDRKVGRG